MIEVIILGSGTGVPSTTRGSSGYCIQVNGESLLFEMGPGTTWRLAQIKVDYKTIRNLFITHRHPDHCSDLIPFLFAMNYTPGFTREDPLDLYAPKGFEAVLKGMMEVFPWIVPKHYPLNIHELEEDEIVGQGWKVRSKPTLHGDLAALSYRLESQGKVIVYSGDSAYCDQLIDNAKNADLFLVECSFPETMSLPGVHLNTIEVARIGTAAQVKRMVLSHLYPHCDEVDIVGQVKRSFNGPVENGSDLQRILL